MLKHFIQISMSKKAYAAMRSLPQAINPSAAGFATAQNINTHKFDFRQASYQENADQDSRTLHGKRVANIKSEAMRDQSANISRIDPPKTIKPPATV